VLEDSLPKKSLSKLAAPLAEIAVLSISPIFNPPYTFFPDADYFDVSKMTMF
jgi:hypothetical protein